jgi:hypothetical protein
VANKRRLIGAKALGRRLGVTWRSVYNFMKLGMPQEAPGRFDPEKCQVWFDDYELQKGLPPDVARERARWLRARANREEHELAKECGLYVHIDDAADAVERVIVAIRAKALSLGNKLSPQVVACSNVNEVRALIDAGADDFLREIAEIDPAGSGSAKTRARSARRGKITRLGSRQKENSK